MPPSLQLCALTSFPRVRRLRSYKGCHMYHTGLQANHLVAGKHPVNCRPCHGHQVPLRCRRVFRVTAQQDGASDDAPSRANTLSVTVKRKQKQVAELLQELGMEALEDRLQSATASPCRPPHRFAQLIQVPGDIQALSRCLAL